MAKRRPKQRFPIGEMTQDLTFNTGAPILSNVLCSKIAEEIAEISEITNYAISFQLGELTVSNVPLDEVDCVRRALQGLQVLDGSFTFSERR